ncbi:unnamed protein product [Auanema sp. JU1783]|nr:unnamed protein product [Auanema sp. JU1783]
MDMLTLVRESREMLEDTLKQANIFILLLCTVVSTFYIFKLYSLHSDDIGIRRRFANKFFRLVRKIPYVSKEIYKTKSMVYKSIHEDLNAAQPTSAYITAIPAKGESFDSLMGYLDSYENMKSDKEDVACYKRGRQSGAVFCYQSDPEELNIYLDIFKKFAYSNPLWPKCYPGIRRMESEVIRMSCTMLHGDSNSCGTITTGGTMSILLACLSHRNKAMKEGILFPEMIIPTSAHAAFTKAAEVFRIKVKKIQLDSEFKVDLKKMESAINKNTCMLVGSAPNFPFGTVDDIEEIAKLGLRYDIPVHVDACLGGFLIPFLDDMDKPKFDFLIPGVSSISADTHKYGLAPKGSSVVLFRNRDLLHNQYFCDTDWQGGIYASATLEGSRSGLNIALCWAALLFQGRETYQKNAEDIRRCTRQLRDGIKQIDGLRVMGASDVCIASFTSDLIDINLVHSELTKKEWHLTALQFPSGIHLMLTKLHTQPGVIEELLKDLRLVVEAVKSCPNQKLEGTAAIYGMAQRIPDRSLVQEVSHCYLDAVFAAP